MTVPFYLSNSLIYYTTCLIVASLFHSYDHSFYLNSSLSNEAFFACTTTLKFASLFHSIGYDTKEIHTFRQSSENLEKEIETIAISKERKKVVRSRISPPSSLLSLSKYSVFLEYAMKRKKREGKASAIDCWERNQRSEEKQSEENSWNSNSRLPPCKKKRKKRKRRRGSSDRSRLY